MSSQSLIELIREKSNAQSLQGQSSHPSISHKDIENLSAHTLVKYREIEIMALENNIIPERYVRNLNTFSAGDQIRLLKSSVCVVGLGGLGGIVVEILSRTGIGKLKFIDGDVFEESNLNRQFISTSETIGFSKAREAENRVHKINPSIETQCFDSFLNKDNAQDLLTGTDVVVDCLDNLKTRFLIEQECKSLNIPLVFGAVAGHQGQVMTIFPEDEGLAKIYGHEGALPEKGIELQLGALASCVSVIASMECTEVIKILLKKGNVLRNRLLLVNLWESVFEVIAL
ncbi:MAG: HesA/MoeB/ThiF family protein [Desulfobacteraceae bacterium]|nr:HesA/MoeB/ThiF family protein [Desulfobacteraceae bacterium]MBU4001511.1 HesA/MoeB/ThiF family protein [Pseudomonadota bacterium]MBU4056174.1 HesA/MoeB/ThiF family protein [Pseudomonadota bacterium]